MLSVIVFYERTTPVTGLKGKGRITCFKQIVRRTLLLYISCGLVWHVSRPDFLNAASSLCVWCGPRFALLITAVATKHRCKEKKTRKATNGNLRRALFNKVLKYYPKLKDIHTYLKSSPPPPIAPLPLFLSKHSSRCGLVSMVTVPIKQPKPIDFSFRCR